MPASLSGIRLRTREKIKTENGCIPRVCRSRTMRSCRLHVVRGHGGALRFERRKSHCDVLRNAATGDRDQVSRGRIFRARVFELEVAAFRRISRSAFVSCRSRQIIQSARSNIFPYFIQEWSQSAIVRKIIINLAIPSGIFTFSDEGCQLGQLPG